MYTENERNGISKKKSIGLGSGEEIQLCKISDIRGVISHGGVYHIPFVPNFK